MPRRTDIEHILVIGSGPIVIGQACEFDYSGTQVCRTLDEAIAFAGTVDNRVVIRPSFTMGGLGSGLANDAEQVAEMVARGLAASPVHEVLVEESVLGWKEFELELMRDKHDNVVVVCSIENLDPMGVHTGDSITVAPAMTLTDREYQHMRDIGIAVLREVGVDTGGCNIQFAIDPADGRLYYVEQALRAGASVEQVAGLTGIDPWFVDQIALVVEVGAELRDAPTLSESLLRKGKRHGLSDRQIAALRPELAGEDGVRALRHRLGIRPVFKTVDTCAAEFAATTPYHYSTYDEETEVAPQRERPKVIILGSGPNRIGQGIEFDYSCVHAVMALRDAGYETVMINCNPETVSTDYDTSDRLYFEPLTLEDVLEVVHAEQRSGTIAGVIVQLGGQTPLGLAQRLKDAGVPIVGTSPEAIHKAEERGAF